ncbi:hypothetical protein [Phaeobacter italicus]|uniref:hypothetical protein n=1 Tax=Phaeobacter italicus TaxID=481446 RepID=UPI00068049BE|nr:hypothetical protein [Phaeobacter italicus]
MAAGLLELPRKLTHIQRMDVFAVIFALVMLAAAVAATIAIGIYAGGIWGALAFAAVLFGLYKAFSHQTGPSRPLRGKELNAFQKALSED